MDWAIYGALIVGTLAWVAALAFLFVRGREAFRALKRLSRGASAELERLAELSEQASTKAAAAADTEELVGSVTRLRVSLNRLAVLREALDEVNDSLGRVVAFYPRK